MAENLKVTHYRNGDEIPTGYSNAEWADLGSSQSDAYAVYDDDSLNAEIYGNLYNWYAVDNESGICPEGWYIPSDDEFKLLEMHLGMSESEADTTYWRGTDEGGKLKEESLEYWNSPNTGATNESGFTGLPGGARSSNAGGYFNRGIAGYFWTSTWEYSNDAWHRIIQFNISEVARLPGSKRSGKSVRCITYESESSTILVPQEFLTIQTAIEAASDGDTVRVSAGTYFDHLNFNGKHIVVEGEDKETTIIDGSQNNGYGVVHFSSGEDSTAVLSGFTLQNGYSLWGAGIRCEGNSSPTLKDLIITNNSAQGGGGMFVTENSDPTLIRVAIIDNSAYSYFGGGMYIKDYSDPKFINVTISDNSAEMYGGGMSLHSSNPTLTNVTISGNSAGSKGGGIHISVSSIIGSNLLINNNYAEGHGAGIFISAGSDINLNKSTIASNIVGEGDTFGAGIYADGGTAVLVNSIVYYNRREGDYGINYNLNGYTMDILDEYTVSYSDIEGDTNWIPDGESNISIAPEVNDFENGDFTLQSTSPCIDAGTADTDGDGYEEIIDYFGSAPDMGAFEYEQVENCLDLNEGANLISFSTLPQFNDFPDCIEAILGEGEATMNMDNGWVGSLTELSCEDGYWLVNTCDDFEWCYSGVECYNSEYSLHEGNNLISYSLLDCGSIDEVLPDDMEECIYAISGEGVAALSTESGWVGSLSELCPDEGYWFVNICDEITFTFDEPAAAGLARKQVLSPSPCPYSQSSQQAFYFIESVENIEMGDWILAYSGDKVIGARQWQGSIIDVPAMGSDGSKYTEGYMEAGIVPAFKLQRGGELINLKGYVPVWSKNGFHVVSNLTQATILPETFSLQRAYPNPFNPITTISFALPKDSNVLLEVYDINGRIISNLKDNIMKAGCHSVIWNADSYSSGVYFVKMVAGEFVNTQKLMLIK